VVELIRNCKLISERFSELINDDAGASTSYKSPVIFNGLPGRPRYDITRVQLQFWLGKHSIFHFKLNIRPCTLSPVLSPFRKHFHRVGEATVSSNSDLI
jgi:hypothetical protein